MVTLKSSADRTMVQVVSRRPLTAKVRVLNAGRSTQNFVGEKLAQGQLYLRVFQISPPVTFHKFCVYHQGYINLAAGSVLT